ncbi:Thymidylate kinase [Granulibacter bethesdensis]|nr:Thymidylate kinase [Granulibacter bethesdensis]
MAGLPVLILLSCRRLPVHIRLMPSTDALNRFSSSSGRFITLEGGEGAGKSTQTRAIAEALESLGIRTLVTREPGGTEGAEQLRSLLLYGPDWDGLAETLLHFAARAQHVARTIRPALEQGIWVLCDRYYDSTMAYQGYCQGADRQRIAALSAWLGLDPEVTLVLDAPVEASVQRLATRSGTLTVADRYERLGKPFFEQVRAAFLDIAASSPQRCVVLDGIRPPAEVTRMALAALAEKLGDPRLAPAAGVA